MPSRSIILNRQLFFCSITVDAIIVSPDSPGRSNPNDQTVHVLDFGQQQLGEIDAVNPSVCGEQGQSARDGSHTAPL
jgi:hypothetical protein